MFGRLDNQFSQLDEIHLTRRRAADPAYGTSVAERLGLEASDLSSAAD